MQLLAATVFFIFVSFFFQGKLVDSENKVMYYLRDVSLSSQGEYECEASNMEGLSRSPKLSVNILRKWNFIFNYRERCV